MKNNQDVDENQAYNPEKFAEPRTMPKGWDLSGLVKHSKNEKPLLRQDPKSEQVGANYGNTDEKWGEEKFSDPRTTPKNWDVSALK
jgi:hypothetical protein